MKTKLYNISLGILKISSFFFIFFFLKKSFNENNIDIIDVYDLFIENYFSFIISLLFLNIGIFLNFFIWQEITKKNNCDLNLSSSFYGFFLSELTKYIPGKVLTLATKGFYYKMNKKNLLNISKSILIEQIASFKSLGFAILIYLIIFHDLFYQYLGLNYFFIIIISLGVLFSIFFVNVIKFFLEKVRFLSNHVKILFNLEIIQTFKFCFLYLIANFFFSLSLLFIFIAFFYINLDYFEIVKILSSLNIGNFLSMIIFFMPAGIGIKEIGTFYFVKDIGSLERILLILLIFRIFNILSEVILFLFSYLVKKIVKN